jgi:hypothetical protein
VGLSDWQAEMIGWISVATGSMRGSVPRDGYGKREITGIASTEEPWRLEAQLQLLARAAMAFGRSETEAVELARAVALGTVPPDRMRSLEVLVGGGSHSVSAVAREKQMHRHVTRRALEDLQQLQITDRSSGLDDGDDDPYRQWQLAVGKDGKLTDIADACAYVIRRKAWHEK